MTAPPLPTLLCVDDEPAILDGLRRQLRGHFRVTTAPGGIEALNVIESAPEPFAVIMSDMMMPTMNGAEFLRRARAAAPNSVRVLLTGQADIQSAAAAVNGGAISRFLTKPCNGDELVTTLNDCASQYALSLMEQDVLERTVRASIDALAQTLALAAPAVFARVTRIQRTVRQLAEATQLAEQWAVEVAVTLSQLGAVTLPDECLASLETGKYSTPKERLLASRVPGISISIIERVPRLEPVCTMIAEAFAEDFDSEAALPASAILKTAFALDLLEARPTPRDEAIEMLRTTLPATIHSLLDHVGPSDERAIVDIDLATLVEGLEIAQDVYNHAGVLLVGRGSVSTPTMIARLRNCLASGQTEDRVRVREWRS